MFSGFLLFKVKKIFMQNVLTQSLLAVIFIPFAGSFFLPLAGRISVFLRNILSLILILIALVCAVKIMPFCLQGQTLQFSSVLPLKFNFIVYADSLAVFMAIVSSAISAIIVAYSFNYISNYEHQSEYYFMVTFFLAAMMGIVFSANLIFLYIFWEITALTSWRLIGFFREKQYVLRADKALLITISGALVMLWGFIRLYQETGSFDLLTIKEIVKTQPISYLTITLILVGIFSKSAVLPFQVWLPDAGVAPSPITALLHAAVLVKIGVYVFARLFIVTMPLDLFWQNIIPIIAAISSLVSAGAALVDTNLKKIIAYSTISQISFIFLGFSWSSEIGIAGGLLFILMHGLSKAGLFLCAGIVEQKTKTKDITKLGGLIHSMPLTTVSFLFCAFSVMGIPPLGGFFSKYMIVSGTLNQGRWIIAAVFLSGAVMTILYLFRVFNLVFLGEAKTLLVNEGSISMVICATLLALLSLLGGIFIRYPNQIINIITQQIIGIK
jgi:NADH:ubiquinone oxidoreductase subunit 5 (subunit L)/multisubunit Na+/H+ antiporter MnhA subunit